MSVSNTKQLDDSIAKIKQNKETLQAAADGDLPCSVVASALLEVAEDGE